jgi:TPR repeat protein
MKKIILSSLVIAVTALASFITVADEFDDAMYNLNRGEFRAAITELEPLLVEGYAPAQYQMALIYQKGQGVLKSTQKAFDLFSLAAEQNYPDAQFDLAIMYTEGAIVPKNLPLAFSLTQKAAKKKLASAQYNLGVMYYNGQGVKKDFHQASKAYTNAAEQNYALAQFNLALMYYEGKGVEKSVEKSFIWNSIAAMNGYANAEKSRIMDMRGLGSEQIERARIITDEKYKKIIRRAELKAKLENKKRL